MRTKLEFLCLIKIRIGMSPLYILALQMPVEKQTITLVSSCDSYRASQNFDEEHAFV